MREILRYIDKLLSFSFLLAEEAGFLVAARNPNLTCENVSWLCVNIKPFSYFQSFVIMSVDVIYKYFFQDDQIKDIHLFRAALAEFTFDSEK